MKIWNVNIDNIVISKLVKTKPPLSIWLDIQIKLYKSLAFDNA